MENSRGKTIKFIDLFAGIWSTRIWFEQACKDLWLNPECVFTSEIKEHAVEVYQNNFPWHTIHGDITKISASEIPDFDFLLGGFPCQAFSTAGARKWFLDTRWTLFFEIERILREKNPAGFLLENVEWLVNHDRVDPNAPIGRTLETILNSLDALGYTVTWKVLNATHFWVPQERKRIYIVWTKKWKVDMDFFPKKETQYIKDVMEVGKETISSEFVNKLFKFHKPKDLYWKSIKDKRGGSANVHSWDIELKWPVSQDQKDLLNKLLKERRKKHWKIEKGIKWMDGMPLTLNEISTFSHFKKEELKDMLDDLVKKWYLAFEHPKDEVEIIDEIWNTHKKRQYATHLPKGYNIVAWKLSFPINKILDPNGFVHTIVATDATRIWIIDGKGLRNLTILEWKRLFGLHDDFWMDIPYSKAMDLLWNTVVAPVIKEISKKLLTTQFCTSPSEQQIVNGEIPLGVLA